jgi:phage terminase small subunit
MAGGKVNTGSTEAGLTGKVALFVAEYQKDHNGTQAAIRAGYSPKTAKVQASRLLSKANVKAAIVDLGEQQIAQVIHETGVTLERVIREIAKGAFFDVRKLFHPNGQPIPVTELDDDTASALAGLDVLEEHRGTGEEREFVGYVKKYKLADRKGYLDMLMKHLGGYAKDNEIKVETTAAPSVVDATREILFALHLGQQQARAKAEQSVPASQAQP